MDSKQRRMVALSGTHLTSRMMAKANGPAATHDWSRTQLGLAIRQLEERFPNCDLTLFIADRDPAAPVPRFNFAANCVIGTCIAVAREFVRTQEEHAAAEKAKG